MARHKELDDEKVLQDIYNSAVEILAAEGLDGLSIRKICRMANISTGTFYHYYPTKSDLMRRLLDYMENFYKNDVVPGLSGSGTEMLYDICIAFVQRMLRRGLDYAKKFIDFDNNDTLTVDDFSQLYLGKVFYGVAQKCIDDGEIKDGFTRHDIVMMAKSVSHGCVLNYNNLNASVDAADIAHKTITAFINGIKK
ncbi:MAG: TetR/AcrR family transcriptional regulator [Oscillospiraceae bacterium]|nr:TetR/AcrR family transcriptional regulator [Oscillospiraceae bacterium]